MGKFALVAMALIASSGCSFVFQSEEAGTDASIAPPVEICEGLGRAYFRGNLAKAPNRFNHIDLNQGTISFWVRALKPLDSSIPLAYFPGITFGAAPNALIVTFSETSEILIPNIPWEPGVDHFVALRWDTHHQLSGYAVGTPNVELRIDNTIVFDDLGTGFVLPPEPEDTQLFFGFGLDYFHVDQGVIYDRPLFVNDYTGAKSELTLMSEDKLETGVLAAAGFDVLLATVSPAKGGCELYAVEAWSLPIQSVIPGNLRVGEEGTGAEGNWEHLDPTDEIFAGGGFRVAAGATATMNVDVAPNVSYVLELLSHSSGTDGRPVVSVTEAASGNDIVVHRGGPGTRENPLRSLLTFTTGSTVSKVDITLAAETGDMAFHSLALRPNLLVNAGFEINILPDEETWVHEFKASESPLKYETMAPYAGTQSVCLSSGDSPDVLRQEPRNMNDNALYLFGSQLKWNGQLGSRPGVRIGNGSLFATGVPLARTSKAGVPARDTPNWQGVAAAGRRFDDSSLNAQNDFIRFGTHSQGGATDVCLDSAFTILSNTVTGTHGPFDLARKVQLPDVYRRDRAKAQRMMPTWE